MPPVRTSKDVVKGSLHGISIKAAIVSRIEKRTGKSRVFFIIRAFSLHFGHCHVLGYEFGHWHVMSRDYAALSVSRHLWTHRVKEQKHLDVLRHKVKHTWTHKLNTVV